MFAFIAGAVLGYFFNDLVKFVKARIFWWNAPMP